MITVPNITYSSHSDASYIGQKAVTELYKQMKEQTQTPTRSVSSAANLTSLCVDISPSSSNFFEVLYIGKIKVWQKKVPDTFVDDALEKFNTHEMEKIRGKQLGSIGRLKSESDIIRRSSSDSSTSDDSVSSTNVHPLLRSQSVHSSLLRMQQNQIIDTLASISEKNKSNDHNANSDVQNTSDYLDVNNANSKAENIDSYQEINRVNNINSELNNDVGPTRSKSILNLDDHNRTMVLQVDRTDLRLISPDRKIILLHKQHKDIATCVQGQVRSEHFGFICKEGQNTFTYVGYIFKCESASIASDAMAAITQAFLNNEVRPKHTITSCDHCPMVWYHKLCVEVENMSDRKTQAAIFRRVEQLDEEEQSIILTKYRGAETDSVREQNEFLMMLLRAHCESKQLRHTHDTAENRSEFLNQYLGGSTIFTKAKRSLSNSFDQLLKRRVSVSKDDLGGSTKGLNLPINNNLKEPSPNKNDLSDRESESGRSQTSTTGSQGDITDLHNYSGSLEKDIRIEKEPKSPMMDIFLKVGNSPKSNFDNDGSANKRDAGSWRQAIIKRVATVKQDTSQRSNRKMTKEELRILWKKSIYQAILLVRMEKENATIRAKQEESAVKRIKLEYDEMRMVQRELEVWEIITNKEGSQTNVDSQMLLRAIRQGVPRAKRGDVWQFLAEKYVANIAPLDTSKYPNYHMSYENLLKQLTSYQHAILIDLGRTFPNHSYFSSPLGPGQLALFNLLKAYSLLDPDVGYCQGLSFVAGILLLHMEESRAFLLLKHLMFRRGMRTQYLPDMASLQVKLYQLSRLLHDQIHDVYVHFDQHEVTPTLYAAPWLLTVFSSQFPLGFVTRVFDLIFLEGPEVIFRVALALLIFHKEKLLQCDSFEEIMNYLKEQLPNIDKITLDKIMKEVYASSFTKQLNEYKVEYQVLQEELTLVQPQVEAFQKLEAHTKILTEQNKALMQQLELSLSNVQRLEKTRVLQQSQINKLEMQNRALDVTIGSLGNFVQSLIEQKLDLEIPDDVQRILSQLSFTERIKHEVKPHQNNLLRMFQRSPEKIMTKSQSMGLINLPTNVNNKPDQTRSRTSSLSKRKEANPNLTTTPSNSAERISKFFSGSHHNILQQKLNAQNNILSNTKIDITVQEFKNEDLRENNPVEFPFVNNNISPTNSEDSGVVSPASNPLSPKSVDSHPLSNCDVSFMFNGTRELKTIRNINNLRQICPDITNK
ncbi:TBC1 domain family member 1 isoform X2 [Diabrotica virgifera virgifera]|uniref:TBC1 domain family member 1 isoform X1 n=1 Tax=Diabrotica virgifera virgifera TaxID=50390 RepID=A0A6P7FSM9_DIAVI|nr:TBC1 domain family member 1 isoform X2 [Diabrotica virgifera virgifera]